MNKYIKNNPVRTLEANLQATRSNITWLWEELEKANQISETVKKQRLLTKINKELWEELKKLSENSTLLCDELQKKQLKKKKE